jgi:N6-adenosine-specific RNA methylase IME4
MTITLLPQQPRGTAVISAAALQSPAAIDPDEAAADRFAQRINAELDEGLAGKRRTFAAHMRAGRILLEAKDTLRHGTFQRMVREKLRFGFNKGQAELLMRVARHPVLKATPVSLLPPSTSTLNELIKLNNNDRLRTILDGDVSAMTRVEAIALVNRINREARLERIRKGAHKHRLANQYPIGLCDSPWQTTDHPSGYPRQVETHYDTLSIEELKNFKVDDGRHVSKIFAQDAILPFWTIDRFVLDGSALAILAAWGFVARTKMTWIKPRMGLGTFVRNQTEDVIIATRGEFPAPETHLRHSSVFYGEPWCKKHSAKPNELYAIIETMYPNIGPRVELFARQYREGWDGMGHEYPGHPEEVAMLEAAE